MKKGNITIDKKGVMYKEVHQDNKVQLQKIDYENPQAIPIADNIKKYLQNIQDAAYKQGFMEGYEAIQRKEKEIFISGIEASKTIEWSNESEEINRVCKEWGY